MSDSTAVSVFDARGEMVSSNAAHSEMLGVAKDFLIGRHWREWTVDEDVAAAETMFARCLAGQPVSFVRQILRSNGTIATVRCQGFVTSQRSVSLVVGTMKLIATEPKLVVGQEALNTADYVCDMAAELARMTETVGLKRLREALTKVAGEAGDLAEVFRKDAAVRH